jgi:hypothetical protein
MHDIDPSFRKFSYRRSLNAILHDLGMSDPIIAQSMYIFKVPHVLSTITAFSNPTLEAKSRPTRTGRSSRRSQRLSLACGSRWRLRIHQTAASMRFRGRTRVALTGDDGSSSRWGQADVQPPGQQLRRTAPFTFVTLQVLRRPSDRMGLVKSCRPPRPEGYPRCPPQRPPPLQVARPCPL